MNLGLDTGKTVALSRSFCARATQLSAAPQHSLCTRWPTLVLYAGVQSSICTYRLTLGCRKYTRGAVLITNEGVFLQPRVNLFVAMATVVADNDN